MKGTATLFTNIKPLAGGSAIAGLQVGDYAYGDVGATDLMNFTHFYRANGSKVELGVPCKATKSQLILKLELETPPIDPPPVDPPPVPLPVTHTVDVIIDGVNVYHKELR